MQSPKERWLHTRITEALEEALKQEARRRRQPVSLLVRNVLEGALDLVEDIVETSLGARPASRGRPRRRAGALDDVYGWQEIILNRSTDCARCGTALAAGLQAFRGLTEHQGPPTFLCDTCVGRLRRPGTNGEEVSR